MNKPLEVKKKKVEIMRMHAAKADAEVRVMERMEEIDRIEKSMVTTDERIAELEKELKHLEQ